MALSRTAAVALASAATAAFASLPAVAGAASGPPPPTSTNGHAVQLVASGMHTPTSFAFHGGTVFEGDGGVETAKIPNGGVFAIRHGIATLIPGSPLFVSGLNWHRGALYVAGGALNGTSIAWVIQKWTGWNGAMFAHQRTIYRAPAGFQGFNGIGFGANGRLYVGVDVGLLNHNDHGPANISPHVYQILSMTAGGRHVQVFARGIRQPWQMVFPRGSNSPYVTNLGQDSGAKNPPDFILRVRAGQNYGFPTCNHTNARACRRFARPWRMLRPHLDPMGIVLRRGTLYITSFLGPRGKGPGGVVYALRARRHSALRPLVKGFVAPIVGLGRSGRWLYVGELTGQVFRVRI